MIRREFLYLGWYLLLCIPVIIVYIKFSVKAKREWLTLVGQVRPEVMPGEEKREYIRLESAFPVEFQRIEEAEGREFNIHQGFTKNLSKNGMFIESLTVRGRRLEDLVPNRTRLKLIMNIPSEAQAITALATVRWVRKTEDLTIDRYLIGVSYDEIAEPDLAKIIRYALWFRRRPDILAIVIVIALMLVVALLSTILISKDARSQLERRVRIAEEQRLRLTKEVDAAQKEKEEIEERLGAISQEYTALLERYKTVRKRREYERIKEEAPVVEEVVIEEAVPELEEVEPKEEVEEALEPIVELRRPPRAEDQIVVEPNITRRMIESEKKVYKTFRDYILKEDVQLLDRYCSEHRTSIYHAGGLFALAELRYKNRHMKEMTVKAYRDVIKLYPKSKYASYASHRLEQISRNLSYNVFSLRYYHREYNLPPLFDYRELEPYKE